MRRRLVRKIVQLVLIGSMIFPGKVLAEPPFKNTGSDIGNGATMAGFVIKSGLSADQETKRVGLIDRAKKAVEYLKLRRSLELPEDVKAEWGSIDPKIGITLAQANEIGMTSLYRRWSRTGKENNLGLTALAIMYWTKSTTNYKKAVDEGKVSALNRAITKVEGSLDDIRRLESQPVSAKQSKKVQDLKKTVKVAYDFLLKELKENWARKLEKKGEAALAAQVRAAADAKALEELNNQLATTRRSDKLHIPAEVVGSLARAQRDLDSPATTGRDAKVLELSLKNHKKTLAGNKTKPADVLKHCKKKRQDYKRAFSRMMSFVGQRDDQLFGFHVTERWFKQASSLLSAIAIPASSSSTSPAHYLYQIGMEHDGEWVDVSKIAGTISDARTIYNKLDVLYNVVLSPTTLDRRKLAQELELDLTADAALLDDLTTSGPMTASAKQFFFDQVTAARTKVMGMGTYDLGERIVAAFSSPFHDEFVQRHGLTAGNRTNNFFATLEFLITANHAANGVYGFDDLVKAREDMRRTLEALPEPITFDSNVSGTTSASKTFSDGRILGLYDALSFEAKSVLVGLFANEHGPNWASTMSTEDWATFAVMAQTLSTYPPGYAAYVLDKIGSKLLSFDAESSLRVLNLVGGFVKRFHAAGDIKGLNSYVGSLETKLLSVKMSAEKLKEYSLARRDEQTSEELQFLPGGEAVSKSDQERNEQLYQFVLKNRNDVRVQLPSEGNLGRITVPTFGITIDYRIVYKGGSTSAGSITPGDLIGSRATVGDLEKLLNEGRADLFAVRLTIPKPRKRFFITSSDLQSLTPDVPVREYAVTPIVNAKLSDRGSRRTQTTPETESETNSNTFEGDVSVLYDRQKHQADWQWTRKWTDEEGSTTDKFEVSGEHVVPLALHNDEGVAGHTRARYEVKSKGELTDETEHKIEGEAILEMHERAGANAVFYFKKVYLGEQAYYRIYIGKRLPGGSAANGDFELIPAEQAERLYGEMVAKARETPGTPNPLGGQDGQGEPSTVPIGVTGIQGKIQDGGVKVTLDGAFLLFYEKEGDDVLEHVKSEEFQGAAASLGVGSAAAIAAYEHSREGRLVVGGGYTPGWKHFSVGRVFAKGFDEGTDSVTIDWWHHEYKDLDVATFLEVQPGSETAGAFAFLQKHLGGKRSNVGLEVGILPKGFTRWGRDGTFETLESTVGHATAHLIMEETTAAVASWALENDRHLGSAGLRQVFEDAGLVMDAGFGMLLVPEDEQIDNAGFGGARFTWTNKDGGTVRSIRTGAGVFVFGEPAALVDFAITLRASNKDTVTLEVIPSLVDGSFGAAGEVWWARDFGDDSSFDLYGGGAGNMPGLDYAAWLGARYLDEDWGLAARVWHGRHNTKPVQLRFTTASLSDDLTLDVGGERVSTQAGLVFRLNEPGLVVAGGLFHQTDPASSDEAIQGDLQLKLKLLEFGSGWELSGLGTFTQWEATTPNASTTSALDRVWVLGLSLQDQNWVITLTGSGSTRETITTDDLETMLQIWNASLNATYRGF